MSEEHHADSSDTLAGRTEEARGARSLPRARNGWIGKSMLVAWMVVTGVGLAALSLKHMASLPKPANEALLSRAMLQLRRGSGRNFLVHVISADCSCSPDLFAHLVARRPFSDAEEAVLFVGTDPGKQESAQSAGFTFTAVSAQELVSRFGLEAAPVLIVFDAAGTLRYAGGYYEHPATIRPLDEKVYAQLATGPKAEPLPVFGCAVSPRIKESLNPLGAVYSKH
jgi:hypothetical protein